MRRFNEGQTFEFASLLFRIVEGTKAPGDLRLEWRTMYGWRAVPLSAVQFMADFFADNEKHLTQYRGHWHMWGDSYFLRSVFRSARNGWESEANLPATQRERWMRDA
jgi:hypothetical protein